jgi:hypothetical protein
MFSLNGHPIASTSIDDSGSPAGLPVLKLDNGEAASVHSGSGSGGDSGSPSVYESSHSTTYTGGIAFLKREFLRWGDLFVVGTGAQVALYRCVPGVRRFEDEDVEPWRLVKQGVLHGSDLVGSVTAVRFAG